MSKAIKLTSKVKSNNPEMFAGRSVGDIFEMNIPQTFVSDIDVEVETTNDEGKTVTVTEKQTKIITRYDVKTEYHKEDGFAEIVEPLEFNSDTHKLGKLIELGNTYTYELIPYTDEELAENEERKIPLELTRSQIRQSFILHGYTLDLVDTKIAEYPDDELVPNSTVKVKDIIKIKWENETTFERKHPQLQAIANLLSIDDATLKSIYKIGGKL